MRSHVFHFAVKTLIEPRLQAGFRVRQIDIGDTHVGKPEFAPPRLDTQRQCE